jgi:hypothetical protein
LIISPIFWIFCIIFKEKNMKRNIFITLFITILLTSCLYGQEGNFFVPREVKTAIKNQTRTTTGIPGPNYWQNKVDYKIEANFNAETGKLIGKQTVTYINNSPNSLNTLVFNLYPNLFKKGNKRDCELDPRDIHDGMQINKISVDGVQIDPKSNKITYEDTKMNLSLPKLLSTKAKVAIVMEWEFVMQANTQIRVGKSGINTWFIGYWYPQIAVYDDVFGWDKIDYDGVHEFYSPFANFDVKITAPANQIIWATGVWQNPDQILNQTYLDRYNDALKSGDLVKIVKEEDLANKITKGEKENTWYYVADNVTDFSFATSDKYLWDGVSVVSDKKQNKSTFVQAAYNKTSKDFYDVAEIGKKSIEYFSNVMPAVPFPYPRMTAFNGGVNGMEFPMMVHDPSTFSKSETLDLTSHEISHTYFPFLMGINQERYAWMDEGWAMFFDAAFQEQEAEDPNQNSSSTFEFVYFAGTSNEMPMMVPSFYMKGFEYYMASYYRPELAYRVLQNLLGKDLFLKALQEYVKRWNGKYPGPYDFFYTFNNVAKQDLTWFWKPWFFEIAIPDLAIKSVNKENNDYTIEIEQIGGLPVPIELNIDFTDGTKTTISKTAEVWKSGNRIYQIKHTTTKTISKCSLGAAWIPDVDYSNNKM